MRSRQTIIIFTVRSREINVRDILERKERHHPPPDSPYPGFSWQCLARILITRPGTSVSPCRLRVLLHPPTPHADPCHGYDSGNTGWRIVFEGRGVGSENVVNPPLGTHTTRPRGSYLSSALRSFLYAVKVRRPAVTEEWGRGKKMAAGGRERGRVRVWVPVLKP